jgi:hypothetical protein
MKRKKVKKAKKSKKKVKKSKKNDKIDLNFASLCFASKQKLLNRSEVKNLKRKNAIKKQKNSKNSEKNVKKAKKSEKIDLNFASLCFASKQKLLK